MIAYKSPEETRAFIEEHAPKVGKRWYPRFHVAPACGWCNDPNGLVYFGGQYHLFYQHYPYEPKWGPMHWAHDTSRDLVHWERQEVALYPDEAYDAGGCFSGCAAVSGDELYLIYTGHVDVVKVPGGPDRVETQNVAVSKDGLHFEKFAGNPVMKLLESVSTGEDHHFRDPKVWQHDGKFYAVVGAQTAENVGQVLLFESEDLKSWSFKGVMASASGNEGFMWECPNFAEFDGMEALIMSPQGVEPEEKRYFNLHQSIIMTGKLDYETAVFERGEFSLLDCGYDFYAPQVMTTPDGRTLFFGWLTMWESAMPEQADGWAGLMTVPRELHFRAGKVVTTPARELTALRGNSYTHEGEKIAAGTSFQDWKQETGEIVADFDLKNASSLTLRFAAGTADEVALTVEKATGEVTLTRRHALTENEKPRYAKLGEDLDKLSVRVYMDRSSLEFFLGDGEAVLSTRFYPEGERLITLEAAGEAVMTTGTLYELAEIF